MTQHLSANKQAITFLDEATQMEVGFFVIAIQPPFQNLQNISVGSIHKMTKTINFCHLRCRFINNIPKMMISFVNLEPREF